MGLEDGSIRSSEQTAPIRCGLREDYGTPFQGSCPNQRPPGIRAGKDTNPVVEVWVGINFNESKEIVTQPKKLNLTCHVQNVTPKHCFLPEWRSQLGRKKCRLVRGAAHFVQITQEVTRFTKKRHPGSSSSQLAWRPTLWRSRTGWFRRRIGTMDR